MRWTSPSALDGPEVLGWRPQGRRIHSWDETATLDQSPLRLASLVARPRTQSSGSGEQLTSPASVEVGTRQAQPRPGF